MRARWRPRGRIDRAPVAHVTFSTGDPQVDTLIASTPAGLHISHDRGRSWSTTGRGVIGPFIQDLASNSDGTALVTTPAGLGVSRDGGDTWQLAAVPESVAAIALLDHEHYLAGSATSGDVWHGELSSRRLQRAGMLPEPVFRIVATDSGLYAAGSTLHHSPDRASTWTTVTLPVEGVIDDVAPFGRHLLVATSSETGLWLVDGDQARRITIPETTLQILSIATSGTTIVLGARNEVLVSTDRGERWSARPVDGDVVSIAVSQPGASIAAGVTTGEVIMSGDLGRTWQRSSVVGGSVVVDLAARGPVIRATTVEGAVLEAPLGDHLDDWRDVTPSHIITAAADPRVQAAVRDNTLAVTVDGGETWTPVGLELPYGRTIEDTAIGCSRTDGQVVTAAGTRGPDGRCEVWLQTVAGEWRRVIAHPAVSRRVSLSMGNDERSLFAAIGDSVYRPSRMGATLFSREVVDPARALEGILLDGRSRPDGDHTLVLLTSAGLYLSVDGGLGWQHLDGPEGPPLTAFSLVLDEDGVPEVLAAQLGGALYSVPIDE